MARIEKVHPITVTHLKGTMGRALVSAYGNVDWQGDRVIAGAFTKTIADWEASGDPCPFIWSHSWADPFAHIGTVRKFTDTPRGLMVDFEIDESTDFARQVAKLLDERRITKMSFAYDVVREAKASDGANELLELRLLECGPCLSPANEDAVLLSRKSVQQMLATESGRSFGWAGTTIPKWAVDDLRDNVSGVVESFLDSVYDAAQKERPMTRTNPELDRLNREIDALTGDTPGSDADLIRQIDELSKTATGNILPATVSLLMAAAGRLAQSATRAQAAGLADAEATLIECSRILRTIASGGEGSVEEAIAACRPLIAEFRAVGQTIAAGNLEKDLLELEGGTRFEVGNEDRVVGSVNVTGPKQRTDAEIIAEVERLSPEAYQKPRGRFTQVGRVSTWINPEEDET